MSAREDCPHCEGTGTVRAESKPPHPPSYRRCVCVLHSDILSNVERGMKGLSKAAIIPESPLLGYEKKNLRVRADSRTFKRHMRHVAVRMPPTWGFKVTSDAEIVTAWLGSVALKGMDIIDPDAYMVSTSYLSIPDLVMPPGLLIIRMGVKVARNEASPEVLAEAINLRHHAGKPTWIWDEPNHPLQAGHLFWSDAVAGILQGWDQEVLTRVPRPTRPTGGKSYPTQSATGHRTPPSMGTGNRKTNRGGKK